MSVHLIIGASGQVGEHLLRAASDAGFKAIGTYHSHPVPGVQKLDIRSQREVRSLIEEVSPAVVYLTASLTNVDYCELHPEEGYEINVMGVRNVGQLANELGAKLVYFSSDYIFDGRTGPYRENDPANPICEYGRQKLIAEHYVASCVRDYLIVRATGIYSWERQGKNFICQLLDTLKAGRSLRVPVDQIGNPTYAPNLVQAVVELVLSDAKGVCHVAGPERVNRYELACEAASVFTSDGSLIQPVATSELGQQALRPLSAGMVVEKAAAELTVALMGFRDGLRAMAAQRGPDG